MTSEFGIDLSSADDVDETREVSGLELVAQDALWRLKTPREMGILAEDAPGYGMDLADAIGSAEVNGDAASLPDRIRAELTKDDRILTVNAAVIATVNGPATEWDIVIRCETGEGPFALVGSLMDGVLDLAIELLKGAV